MASFDALESDGVSRVGVGDWSDDIGQSETYDAHLSKNLGDDLLDDLDSYWEDINDRLTIARMVSDSIIKGMVSAVSEEAYERVVAKELEVAKLKNNNMCCCQFRDSEIDVSSSSLRKHDELRLLGHDREFIGLLNKAVKEQLEKLQKCIAITKGLKFRELSISTPDIKELIGNFEESSAVIKNDLDEAFYRLKATLKALCQQVDVIAHTPGHFVEEWKVVDLDIRKEVETMVFCTVVQGLQYECEKKVWDVNKVVALIDDKFNQISSLRHELSSIQKCFDNENLSPQVSIELDHYHRKFSSNHVPSSVQDGNGESKIRSMPEKLPSELKHMKSEELYLHLRTVVTEMKREHESTVHKMTEENFALKRELLKEREPVKERGPFAAAFKKDRDFELIKKNISEIIAKLDVIVGENEKLSEFCNHSREKLDSLLCENHHLKGLLSGQRREVLYLSMHASEKLLPHSWAEEESIHKLVGDLKDALRDELIEASISEEVFKCMIREMAAVRNSSCEDLDLMKSIIMQDIIKTIYEEAFYTVDVATKYRTEENLDLQSSITQQIYGIVFQEVLRDMSMELNELKVKCLVEDEGLVFLERKVTEIENELTRKVEQNQELKHSILVLENSIAKKDQLLLERTALHEKEKADFAEELNSLMCLSTHQEALLSERNEEILLVMGKLEGCQKQLQSYEFEVDKLNKAIELSKDELRKSDEEKTSIKSVLEQKQNYLSSIKVKNSEHNKHMESLCHFIRDLSKSFADFELRIKESMGWHDVRLENLASQLNSLIPKVNMLRRTGFLYKERLEKKSSDLEKAEAEVDLLGDEVDALLSLLEKIYVALDHYSPILQHYPGIIEILKLVKREVSGEAVKAI